jgi:hypothetical protein
MRNSTKKMILMATAVMVIVASLAAPAIAQPQQQEPQRAPTPAEEEPVPPPAEEGPALTPLVQPQDVAPEPQEEAGPKPQVETVPEPQVEEVVAPEPAGPASEGGKSPIDNSAVESADDVNEVRPDAKQQQGEEDDTPSSSEGDTIVVDCIDPDTHQLVVCDSKDEKDKGNKDEEEKDDKERDEKDAVSEVTQAEKLSEEIAPAKEDALAEKAATASGGPPSHEDGQEGYGATVYGCPEGYEYDELADTCLPVSYGFFGPILGDNTCCYSVGEGIAWFGHLPADLLKATGAGLEIGLDYYIGETLSNWGEEIGGPLGWPLQGLGAVFSFAGHATGAVVGGLGQVVGHVSDGVGEVIDDIGDAAEDAWDEITSWF